jgi:Cu+-exporting ATPase
MANSDTITIKVEGMTCSNCARSVELAIADKGGQQIAVDLADKEVIFKNPEGTPIETFEEQIQSRGFVVIKDEVSPKKKE